MTLLENICEPIIEGNSGKAAYREVKNTGVLITVLSLLTRIISVGGRKMIHSCPILAKLAQNILASLSLLFHWKGRLVEQIM